MATHAELYAEADRLKDDGNYEEAAARLQEILAENEGHVLAHLSLAVVYGRLGRHDDAVKHGARACELEPEDPFNFTALSVTYQRAFEGTRNHEYIQRAEEAMARSQMLQGRR